MISPLCVATDGMLSSSLAKATGGFIGCLVTVVTRKPREPDHLSVQQVYYREPEDLKKKLILAEDEEIVMVIVSALNAGIL